MAISALGPQFAVIGQRFTASFRPDDDGAAILEFVSRCAERQDELHRGLEGRLFHGE